MIPRTRSGKGGKKERVRKLKSRLSRAALGMGENTRGNGGHRLKTKSGRSRKGGA